MTSESKDKAPTVEADPLEDLPHIDESTVGSLSEQVGRSGRLKIIS